MLAIEWQSQLTWWKRCLFTVAVSPDFRFFSGTCPWSKMPQLWRCHLPWPWAQTSSYTLVGFPLQGQNVPEKEGKFVWARCLKFQFMRFGCIASQPTAQQSIVVEMYSKRKLRNRETGRKGRHGEPGRAQERNELIKGMVPAKRSTSPHQTSTTLQEPNQLWIHKWIKGPISKKWCDETQAFNAWDVGRHLWLKS